MRKWSILASVAVMALALTACGSNKNEQAASGGEASPSAPASPSEAASPGGEKAVIKVATDASYAPMESMDKDKIVGFDVDFLDAVMKEAGLDYELTNTGWDPLFADLEQGDKSSYDMAISAISITDERKQTFDFSIPYFESVNMILTKEGATIANALELKDKKVAVQGATTAEELMKGIMGEGNADLKRFDSNTLALLELDSGGVDAVVADFAVVQAFVEQHPDKKYAAMYDKTNFAPEYYGIMLPKGSGLKAKIDAAVEKVRASDEYKAMYKEWIGVEPDTTDLVNTK
ncbi:basic amino acid ABC transporter substrate-binding protein [Cohnella thailandensis]|uniref:Transporter substrate-binding domain-containing protein n=1 Tax=Cohnella thailandensis TaxID=557557 RepID=A0A841T5T4_9BACL|nr:basic amino acid ABC transporter substrate-binding protein [Cohnella thailandensis]MBB6637440.1 transporter substrate-binding domain-containing protein [Cohnella thailandensis]MBP1976770.1 polar amino acid transport system substrate-binding protein [Cohnella thailandensis]